LSDQGAITAAFSGVEGVYLMTKTNADGVVDALNYLLSLTQSLARGLAEQESGCPSSSSTPSAF